MRHTTSLRLAVRLLSLVLHVMHSCAGLFSRPLCTGYEHQTQLTRCKTPWPSVSDPRHGRTPQVWTFPTAAAHTFLHTILLHVFLVRHTPKSWKDFLTFSEDPVIRVPHAGGEVWHKTRMRSERERENNGRYLLCPSLTPWYNHLNCSFLILQSNLLFIQHQQMERKTTQLWLKTTLTCNYMLFYGASLKAPVILMEKSHWYILHSTEESEWIMTGYSFLFLRAYKWQIPVWEVQAHNSLRLSLH